MSNKRFGGKRLRSLYREDNIVDEIDPRYEQDSRGQDVGRKQLQLCRQVQRILIEALAACSDELLQSLDVVSVIPASGVGRMLVTCCPSPSAKNYPLHEYLLSLARASGYLRNEVAAGVYRRKTPQLTYQVIPRSE